jgi:uncharacterized protein YjiS (DUF1127 family)
MWTATYDDRVFAVTQKPRGIHPMGMDPITAEVMARHASQMELLGAIVRGLAWLVRPITRWYQREILRTELNALNDHMLADIGVSRDQISEIVAGTQENKIAKTLNRFAAAIQHRLEARRIANELSALDDRVLADMGIERYQISDIANGKFSRNKPVPVPENLSFFRQSSDQPSISGDYRRAA